MRADRLISMLMLLQTRGQMTAQELADRLEVSERTIYRDLDALSASGVPVYAERGPGGGCALLDNYRTNLTGLNKDELRALFLLSIPDPFDDLGMNKALEAAQLKLSAALSTERKGNITQVRERIHLDPAAWFQTKDDVPYLETIQEAIWQNRRLRINYRRSDGEWVKRLIDPYGLVAKSHIWYLVGKMRDDIRVYRVSRIQEAIITTASIERPADFNLAHFWKQWLARLEANKSPCPIKIRVASKLLAQLPHILGEHVQQAMEQAPPPDQMGWTTLNLTFHSFEEARMYVLSFGDEADVLHPQALRQSVVDFATRILTAYTLQKV